MFYIAVNRKIHASRIFSRKCTLLFITSIIIIIIIVIDVSAGLAHHTLWLPHHRLDGEEVGGHQVLHPQEFRTQLLWGKL
jgi:hypothetical protein